MIPFLRDSLPKFKNLYEFLFHPLNELLVLVQPPFHLPLDVA
jgi:hypothetical protein